MHVCKKQKKGKVFRLFSQPLLPFWTLLSPQLMADVLQDGLISFLPPQPSRNLQTASFYLWVLPLFRNFCCHTPSIRDLHNLNICWMLTMCQHWLPTLHMVLILILATAVKQGLALPPVPHACQSSVRASSPGLSTAESAVPSFSCLTSTYAAEVRQAFLEPLCVRAKSLQSCPTLCNPLDCSLPGSSSMGFSRREYWSGLPCLLYH